MGKNNLLIGTARGKLGDVVFYRTGGEQRFRARVKPMNPRTDAQLFQRCIVSTAVKAYAMFVDICDHAFQGYNGKLKNHQRYMRLNIKYLREMALAQSIVWNPFRLGENRYGNWAIKDDTQVPLNEYILSEGDLPQIDTVWKTPGAKSLPSLELDVAGDDVDTRIKNITYQWFCDKYGLEAGTQITFVLVTADKNYNIKNVKKYRLILMPSDGDMNSQLFNVKTGGSPSIVEVNKPNKENRGDLNFVMKTQSEQLMYLSWAENVDAVGAGGEAEAGCVIVSNFNNNEWRRSSTQLSLAKGNVTVGTNILQAMESYEMAQTSSLYLNQSNTGRTVELAKLREQTFDTTNVMEEVDTEKTTKKKKKTQEYDE